MKITHVNVCLGLVWLGLFQYCRRHTFNDPSSFFYDPDRAFQPRYSAVREAEADEFIARASRTASRLLSPPLPRGGGGASLCVGVPSLRRTKEQFMARAIASLTDHLSPAERESIHLVVLLSDWTAKENPAYGQPWLHSIADEVLVYGDDAPAETPEGYRIVSRGSNTRQLVAQDDRNERVQLDYATLADACQARNAEHFLLMEDDVIASRDWFPRLQAALPQVREKSRAKHKEWAYLRLFYTERYMGWNSEEWPVYLQRILLAFAALLALLSVARCAYLGPRRRGATGSSARPVIFFNTLAALLIGLWFPMFVALYFMAGRLLVDSYSPGVHEMPRYGCCAQGLAFPSRHLPVLSQLLKAPPHDMPGDSFIEQIADDGDMLKYAMVPAVLQHVGIRGSSVPAATLKTTWNFSFERVHSTAKR